jgi:hypothetical protein
MAPCCVEPLLYFQNGCSSTKFVLSVCVSARADILVRITQSEPGARQWESTNMCPI